MSTPLFSLARPPSAPIPETGVLRAGGATHDITPALGGHLAGFGSIRSEVSRRVWGRLFATALVIDDGVGGRVALVAIDFHAGTRYLAELVAAETAGELGIGIDRLFLAGSHTHSGPGHVYGNTLYDKMAAGGHGLDRAGAERIAHGIAAAVREATLGLQPANVGHGLARRWGYSQNRSLRAFTNDGARPEQFARHHVRLDDLPSGIPPEGLAVDPRVQVIWAEDLQGAPIGAFATFAAHGTAIPAAQATLSADWCGCAVRAAQDRLARGPAYWLGGATPRRVPIGLAAGAMGDVDVDLPGVDLAGIVALQGTALAAKVGEALGETIERAIADARTALQSTLTITTRFAEPEPAGAWLEDGRKLASYPAFGIPALGGSELGRNFALDADVLSSSLDLESRRGDYRPEDPHAPKLTFESAIVEVFTGRPAAVLPVRLVTFAWKRRVVQLAGLPGEPTTLFAGRMERMLRDRGATSVMVVGVTGDYAGYFTTGREYDRQHYEGASTIWGRCTGDWLIEELRDLDAGRVAPPGEEAFFEAEKDYVVAASVPGAATRPTLTLADGELRGGWSAPREVLPPFGPDPWIVIEQLDGDHWVPAMLDAAQVSDQSRAMFVERGVEGPAAIWTFRYVLPPAFAGFTLRFRLVAKDFALAGQALSSGPVRVP
ncbi:MAG: neutral/alkaline non-lysosomal ceramidase N-terminal domain-containing protein [Byssovorax sp.]